MSEKAIKQPLTKGVAKVPVVMQMETLECEEYSESREKLRT